MIVYRFDVMKRLKDMGFNPARIRREHLISEQALQDIREGTPVKTMHNLNKLCAILDMQPGSILKYIPDEPEE